MRDEALSITIDPTAHFRDVTLGMSEDPKPDHDSGSDEGATGVLTDVHARVERPKLYKVILHNDDYTPMEFVVEVLERFFKKTHAEATEIMLNVHYKGSGLCGVYPFEVAETKVALVTEAARENEYPLQCTLERA